MPRKAKETEKLTDKIEKEKIVTKKTTTRKTTAKKTTSKKSSTKKVATKKVTKKSASKTSTTKKATKSLSKAPIVEYYDLPYKYNKTVVKVLAQTPKTLFIYWEISDDDIEKYKKQYGENFFETTKPVLIIHNNTLNYSFEVEINDFANSWYLHINDSKSNYSVELCRRPIYQNSNIKDNYIFISSSNTIETPNDHILFNNSQKMIYFRNVKTNVESSKLVSSLPFIKKFGKSYNIYTLKDAVYKECNPSSSQFK